MYNHDSSHVPSGVLTYCRILNISSRYFLKDALNISHFSKPKEQIKYSYQHISLSEKTENYMESFKFFKQDKYSCLKISLLTKPK